MPKSGFLEVSSGSDGEEGLARANACSTLLAVGVSSNSFERRIGGQGGEKDQPDPIIHLYPLSQGEKSPLRLGTAQWMSGQT